MLVGSNTAWCHPVLYQRLQAARAARGTKVVVLDPRRTATAEAADLHLPLAPGSDVALFNGLLAYLRRAGRDRPRPGSRATRPAWTRRWRRRWRTLRRPRRRSPPRECGVDPEVLETFYELFAETERVMTVYSQGVNQSVAGTDKVNAIINCHLATGRIGRPGAGPFSVTGQPNAMGGREVGGLANQLAAHMRFDDPADRAALQRVLAVADAGAEARAEGGRAVRRGAGRPDQGAVDRRDQSGRQHAARGPGARGAGGVPVRRGVRLLADRYHRR